jgi:hypothetical protein
MYRSLFFILYSLFFIYCAGGAMAADRVNIFSTSTDWEAVTGLRLRQYPIEFVRDDKLIGNPGIQIYYMDGFPCYGQPDKTEMWFGPNGNTRNGIRIVCLYLPDRLTFGWRVAARNALQDATTGILTCPISRDAVIDMSQCAKGKEWKDF